MIQTAIRGSVGQFKRVGNAIVANMKPFKPASPTQRVLETLSVDERIDYYEDKQWPKSALSDNADFVRFLYYKNTPSDMSYVKDKSYIIRAHYVKRDRGMYHGRTDKDFIVRYSYYKNNPKDHTWQDSDENIIVGRMLGFNYDYTKKRWI